MDRYITRVGSTLGDAIEDYNCDIGGATSGIDYEKQYNSLVNGITEITANQFNGDLDIILGVYPNVTTIGEKAFQFCSNLEEANFPVATTIGNYSFNTSGIKSAYFPNLKTISSGSFSNCPNLEIAYFHSATSVISGAFASSMNLKALVLGNDKVCYADSMMPMISIVNGAIMNGEGYIYVPRSIVDSYKSTAPWSGVANQFRALEDYTVDGTTTGMLDESKI